MADITIGAAEVQKKLQEEGRKGREEGEGGRGGGVREGREEGRGGRGGREGRGDCYKYSNIIQ